MILSSEGSGFRGGPWGALVAKVAALGGAEVEILNGFFSGSHMPYFTRIPEKVVLFTRDSTAAEEVVDFRIQGFRAQEAVPTYLSCDAKTHRKRGGS